jgi:DNA adenine methylase
MMNYNLFGEAVTLPKPRRETKPKSTLVNVATIPQRSPFRYPGGKTWLIPVVRQWLNQENRPVSMLVEPFAGGGIVSLTSAFEKLAEEVIMMELDPEISAVWQTIFSPDNQWLAEKILNFELTLDNFKAYLNLPNKTVTETAFTTILKNRIYHGGIIAKGSAPLKNGENGRGIASRWYPQTLYNRITAIQDVQHRMTFRPGDAFDILQEYRNHPNCYFFIDPPYTVAGKRLYTCYELDHAKLFEYTSKLRGKFMLTYDDTPEVRKLAERFNLPFKTIPMKTTHHLEKNEILITDNLNW